MTRLRKYDRASRTDSSKYLHRMFTKWLLVVALFSLLERANCSSFAVVSRTDSGDRFTNPFDSNGFDSCANISAYCVKELLNQCSECVCNPGTETYRADIQRCVSTDELSNFTGCRYKGIKDLAQELFDSKLPTLDFTRSNLKNIYGLLEISQSENIGNIRCEIANSTGFLNSRGQWNAFSNFNDKLHIEVSNNHHSAWTIERYLRLQWEKKKNKYSGLLIKLQIFCRTTTDPDAPESGCFLFKTKGKNRFVIPSPLTTTIQTKRSPTTKEVIGAVSITTKLKNQSTAIFSTGKPAQTTTKKLGINKNYTYSVSMPVIIGVSAGVGLVILIIIICAICCVRYRTRTKQPEEKPSIVSAEAPKVHFTAQARFSLIQEAAPVDPDDEDYTSLKEDRESYDPYCSLRKDDVDLNVIDTILKDAVSMESMRRTSEPRYSCRLTDDNAVIIESAKRHSPRQPRYHVLEAPDYVNEPDYEEVDSSDDEYTTTSSRLLDTKPPLPEREYHELEPPADRPHSEC